MPFFPRPSPLPTLGGNAMMAICSKVMETLPVSLYLPYRGMESTIVAAMQHVICFSARHYLDLRQPGPQLRSGGPALGRQPAAAGLAPEGQQLCEVAVPFEVLLAPLRPQAHTHGLQLAHPTLVKPACSRPCCKQGRQHSTARPIQPKWDSSCSASASSFYRLILIL